MKMVTFEEKVKLEQLEIKRKKIDSLQVNIGKKCNQSCSHCHVVAGPNRDENMDLATIDRLIELLNGKHDIKTVDITGGAPELNPHFKHLVRAVRGMGLKVIDRCNLTVLLEEGQEDTAGFLAENGVEIVASLPCYTEGNVDSQRGMGTFAKSIKVLRLLNTLGYGQQDGKLSLNLVYNPGGPFLPGQQQKLENDYKDRLSQDHQITFNHLYTITNMPINRFGHQLKEEGKLEEYMQLLSNSFNVSAVAGVMCSKMVSIGWDGSMYDCDFNQMLEKPISAAQKTIFDITGFRDITDKIVLHDACFGCTAGSGSSCGGSLT